MQCPVLTLNRVSAMTRNRHNTHSSAVFLPRQEAYYIYTQIILRIASNREIRSKCRNNITLDSGTSPSARALNYYVVVYNSDEVSIWLYYYCVSHNMYAHYYDMNNVKRSPTTNILWYYVKCFRLPNACTQFQVMRSYNTDVFCKFFYGHLSYFFFISQCWRDTWTTAAL